MSDAAEPAQMPVRVRSAGGAAWSVLEGGLAQAITFLSFVLIARFVSPSGFGLVALGLALVETLRLALIDPLAIVLTSNRAAGKAEWQGAFWVSIAAGAALTLLCAVLAPVAAALVNEHDLAPVLQAIAATLLFHSVGRVPEGWLVREMRFGALAIRAVAAASAGAAAGVAGALAGWGVYALVAQQLALAVTGAVFAIAASKWSWSPPPSLAPLRAHLKAAGALSPSALGHVLAQNLDIFALSVAAGAAATGLYGLARRIRLAAQIAFAGLGRVALSALSALEEARRGAALTRAASLSLLIAGPIFIGLSCVSPELVALLFGSTWAQSAPVLSILALSGPMIILNDYFEQTLIVLRRLRALALYKLSYAVVLGVAIFLAAQISLTSVALAALACAVLASPVLAVLVRRAMPFSFRGYYAALARSATPCVLMGLAVTMMRPLIGALEPLERLAALSMFGAAVFLPLAWLFARGESLSLLQTGRDLWRRRWRRQQ